MGVRRDLLYEVYKQSSLDCVAGLWLNILDETFKTVQSMESPSRFYQHAITSEALDFASIKVGDHLEECEMADNEDHVRYTNTFVVSWVYKSLVRFRDECRKYGFSFDPEIFFSRSHKQFDIYSGDLFAEVYREVPNMDDVTADAGNGSVLSTISLN